MADNRTPEQIAEDDAIAALAEITVTPELWFKGVKVDAAAFGFPPYTLTKRTFATQKEARDAKAGYDAMCAAGFTREKAFRVWLCDEDAGANSVRDALIARLGL